MSMLDLAGREDSNLNAVVSSQAVGLSKPSEQPVNLLESLMSLMSDLQYKSLTLRYIAGLLTDISEQTDLFILDDGNSSQKEKFKLAVQQFKGIVDCSRNTALEAQESMQLTSDTLRKFFTQNSLPELTGLTPQQPTL